MKKKPLLMVLGMMMLGSVSFAQNGLEQIIVEKYYVSNAADAASADADLSSNLYPTGTLPAGSVTWRVYADLAPGWGVQVVYGESGRPLVLSTTTGFFNHPNGTITGVPLPSLLGSGTSMLDSYFTIGAVSGSNRFGVVKDEDNATGGANTTFTSGILANTNPSAGLPLSVADGVFNSNGNPSQLGVQRLGDAAGPLAAIFDDGALVGNSFNSSNALWAVLGEQQGPLASNRVLLGQFTTNGVFTYALNVQIRNTTTSAIQRYVYGNPSSGDIVLPALSGVLEPCPATSSTTNETACGSFTWNGTTYTTSGTYVFNTINAAGCDSIATLNLTITNVPVWYADTDADSYGNPNDIVNACTQPAGYVGNSNDCDDNNAAVNPLAVEICNGIDDNCNNLIDNADPNYQGIAPAGSISGMLVSCVPPGAGSTTYSVAAVPGATSYNWVVPSGLTIVSGQGTNSIVVSWSSITIDPVIQGTITVTASNACAPSAPSTAAIQLATVAPVTPGSISGASKVCPGDVVTYSVALVARATAYNWSVPAGMTINSGNGTNVISVSVGVGYVGGTVSVAAANICGSSPVRTRTVSLNFPNTPGIISGQANGVCQTNGVAYSIAAIANATSYTWTVPAGATIASGQGTTGIMVDFGAGFTSGQITVVSVNACGNSAVRSLTVSGTPARPGPVSGVVNPACGGQSYQYSVATVPGTSQYLWSVTPGGTVSFPFPLVANGKDAQLTWGTPPLPIQTVQVRASNACGVSLTRTVSVNITNCPRIAQVENANWFVYPNPASGKVFVNMNAEGAEAFTVSVFDATGRLLDVRQFNAQAGTNVFEMELGNYASGIYNLILQSDSGKTVQRLIVE